LNNFATSAPFPVQVLLQLHAAEEARDDEFVILQPVLPSQKSFAGNTWLSATLHNCISCFIQVKLPVFARAEQR